MSSMSRELRYWKNRRLPEAVHVIKTSSGREKVQVRVLINGRRHKKDFGAPDSRAIDLAIAWIQKVKENKRLGRVGLEIEPERWTVAQACEVYWQLHGSQRKRKDGSVNKKACNQFRRNLDYIKAMWGNRPLESISYLDIKAYRERRLKDGVKDSTINREHTVITSLFNRLRYWKRIEQPPVPRNLLLPEDNPGELVEKKSEDEFIRSRILTDEEFKTLYMVADTQIKRIIIAEMNAPLRKEDLKQLTKDKIVRHLKEFKGIQNKTGQDYYIPINGPLDELIRTAPGNEILNFSGFEKRWRRAVARAGHKSLEFRDLRRSAATAMHEGGIKLKVISKMLGHASVSTTERYLGLRAENLHEAGRVLGARFGVPETEKSPFQLAPKLAPGRSENGTIAVKKRTDN